MNEVLGIAADLKARRDHFLSTARISNAARARIMGRHYYRAVAKDHRITVDIKADTRTIATVYHSAEKPASAKEPRKLAKRHYIRHQHADILNAVAESFNITLFALLSPLRNNRTCRARFAAMRLVQKRHGVSTTRIGKMFRRDHTSAMHALRRAEEWLTTSPEWAELYHAAEARLKDTR